MTAFTWALVTACVWGVVPLMEAVGLRHAQTPPIIGVMVRSLGVAVGCAVVALLGSPWSAMRAMGWPACLLLVTGGFLASFVGQVAFYHALRSGAVSQVTPVAGAYPLIAALLGWLLLREPLSPSRALGVACIIVGVILLRR